MKSLSSKRERQPEYWYRKTLPLIACAKTQFFRISKVDVSQLTASVDFCCGQPTNITHNSFIFGCNGATWRYTRPKTISTRNIIISDRVTAHQYLSLFRQFNCCAMIRFFTCLGVGLAYSIVMLDLVGGIKWTTMSGHSVTKFEEGKSSPHSLVWVYQ